MQISLDFYRILGLPPQATLEQIQQARLDRSSSLPRREYSDAAIAARKRIINRAYDILTEPTYLQEIDLQGIDPKEEIDLQGTDPQEHDAELPPQSQSEAAETQDAVAEAQTIQPIEVSERDLIGALLLLYELGEYEQVLEIYNSYVEANRISSQLKPTSSDPDIILTVALSHLEIGRGCWKQGQYDDAARALETSQVMLLREALFISIRSEIQADLFKLRPYRILELLAISEESSPEHKQGLMLLQEMLEARRGIDGTGNDYSGLGIDDFLRFMQQLRSYMTAAEQQTLFEEEARRPSTVASYLAVYALIARGFSQCQPALIRRAKGLLVKLSGRQDVHLEQAVCALLLGQTEEAGNTIEQSSERDKLEFIRECSEGEPDLLPGLCLYCENWLQEEVYPHFRDLRDRIVDLREYFADDRVESYLEELSNANGAVGSEWTPASRSKTTSVADVDRSFVPRFTVSSEPEASVSAFMTDMSERTSYSRVPVLERPVAIDSIDSGASEDLNFSPPNYKTRLKTKDKEFKKTPSKSKIRPKPRISRILIVIFASVSVVAGVAAALAWGWRTLISPAKEEAAIPIEQPVSVLLDTKKVGVSSVAAQPGPLSQEMATKLVETWQVTKSKALGSNHDIALLESTLTDPALSDWRSRAQDLKATNAYLQYIPKSLVIKKFVPKGNDKASAIAQIEETRNYFSNGSLDASSSKPGTSYEVEYVLVRVSDKWLIADMLVAE